MIIPKQLATNCWKQPGREAWLRSLPALLESMTRLWSLRVGAPFDHANVTCSWVAPAVRSDGTSAVLKLAMPPMEGAHEIRGLRFWCGNPTVQLLEADDERGAMLLERCEPGNTFQSEPEPYQDVIIVSLLKRLWRRPSAQHGFRPLSFLLENWRSETLAQVQNWPDPGLVREGLRTARTLSNPASTDALLATDLHAGDLVQHLIVCESWLHADPIGLVRRLADLAEVDRDRLSLWTFVRVSAEPRTNWSNLLWMDIAKALAP